MSNLSKRTSTRRITRPNGLNSIRRIQAELATLIEHAPVPETKPHWRVHARRQVNCMLAALRALYY